MNLPNAKLDRKNALMLWCNERSDYAMEQVILGNQGLIGAVLKSLNQNPQDEDLFSIGIIGIVKALNSYDAEKGFEFSTYAATVVRNEILMSFRKKTVPISLSLEETCDLENGESIPYGDMVPCDGCFEEDVLSNHEICQNLGKLSERDRRILELRIQGKTQREISLIFGLSQSYVSRIIKEIRERICA